MADVNETNDLLQEGKVDLIPELDGKTDIEELKKLQEEREEYWEKPWVKENSRLRMAEEKKEAARERFHDRADDIAEEVDHRVAERLASSDVFAALDDCALGAEVVRAQELERVLDSEDLTYRQEAIVRAMAWVNADLA